MTDYTARRTMMVDTQVRPSDVTKFPIIDAMLSVPREVFVPDAQREVAYMGGNLELGGDRVMLEPRTMGKMLDALDIQPHEVVLDLGCGYGYSTAILARLAESVVAVESDPQMAADAQRTLSETGVDNAAVIEGAPAEGAARHGPYDVIMVQGAVEDVPAPLLDQLREGGRIGCIFMEGAVGTARVGYRLDGRISWRAVFNATAPVMNGFEKQHDFVL
ncbi:protein-L-isoaspartate O-methyltransferase [Brevirhabdus pacifica]|uniref:Protein-L-isoaspartate O-methyltransferase n=1 Tax=Brevirhabdus pacifica TaxID=1267768 RepID=A0A1U7DHI4_9RHOB|nr:protein-L-isoaspartate O-methyltransferase [Brevirhabdus pacifica]APX89338.1 protein-L-isoaspartate O-methyltransferase [Brevirhabdus pacifica]OWU76636.1 protein-L-isoaspartate O-methyltransferase [Loktanella sp. 22II-4b]PJJ86038.1 protein-L-isoaspartate(D-aspartate) O-methyltransferase [Brevirhabdus pacifica]